VSPLHIFRRVAITEAITWGLLLVGMVLKYVTGTTELGVRVFGMLHGIAFVAYCLATLLVGVDQRWSVRRTAVGLLASVPPFCTVLFDRWAERRGALADRWRLTDAAPSGAAERVVTWLLRNPARGALTGLVAVAALTGLALLVGPPAG
jgi:integral membrane protein